MPDKNDFGLLDRAALATPAIGDLLVYPLKRRLLNNESIAGAYADAAYASKHPVAMGSPYALGGLAALAARRFKPSKTLRRAETLLKLQLTGGNKRYARALPKRLIPGALGFLAGITASNAAVRGELVKRRVKSSSITKEDKGMIAGSAALAGPFALNSAYAAAVLRKHINPASMNVDQLVNSVPTITRLRRLAAGLGVGLETSPLPITKGSGPAYMPATKTMLLGSLPELKAQDDLIELKKTINPGKILKRKARGTIINTRGGAVSPGVFAHELGHAIGPKAYLHPLTRMSGRMGMIGGAAGALINKDEQKARLAALLGTGMMLPTIASEIDASARGAAILKKLKVRGRLGAFVGLPTYLMGATTPLWAYGGKKLVDGYKDNRTLWEKFLDRIK